MVCAALLQTTNISVNQISVGILLIFPISSHVMGIEELQGLEVREPQIGTKSDFSTVFSFLHPVALEILFFFLSHTDSKR